MYVQPIRIAYKAGVSPANQSTAHSTKHANFKVFTFSFCTEIAIGVTFFFGKGPNKIYCFVTPYSDFELIKSYYNYRPPSTNDHIVNKITEKKSLICIASVTYMLLLQITHLEEMYLLTSNYDHLFLCVVGVS